MSYKRGELSVHDLVRIMEPIRYVRCGFPTSSPKKLRSQFLNGDQLKIINATIDSLGLTSMGIMVYDKIYDAFAFALMKFYQTMGAQRELITEPASELMGVSGIIVGSEWVKTGKYSTGTRRRLEDVIVHQVLKVEVTDNCPLYGQVVTVLADHVSLIDKEARSHWAFPFR